MEAAKGEETEAKGWAEATGEVRVVETTEEDCEVEATEATVEGHRIRRRTRSMHL